MPPLSGTRQEQDASEIPDEAMGRKIRRKISGKLMKLQGNEYQRAAVAAGNGYEPLEAAILAGNGTEGAVAGAVPAMKLEAVYRSYSGDLVKQARRWGFSPEDAEDLAQEFFLRLAAKDSLAKFDSKKGKFRSFLLTLFQRFLANEWHGLQTLRRGGQP